MLKVGVGFSKNGQADLAAREAAASAMQRAGIHKADLTLVFATSHFHHDYPHILHILHELTKPAQLCGCSAYGVLTGEEEIENSPGIAVLVLKSKKIRPKTFLVNNIFDRNSDAGRELAEILHEDLTGTGPLFLFPDTFNFDFNQFYASFISAMAENDSSSGRLFETGQSRVPDTKKKGRPQILGGGASEEGTLNETFQFLGKSVESNSLTGLRMGGTLLSQSGVAHACHPIGESLMVTRAKGNTIYEISGKPAFYFFSDLFKNRLHKPEEIQKAASLVFLGLSVNPCDTSFNKIDYVVRNILSVDSEEGTLNISDRVEEGKIVSFMVRDPRRAMEETEKMISALAEGFSSQGAVPRFGIYINCCGRGNSLYGKRNVDTGLIRKYFGELPLIGFFSYAEMASTPCGDTLWHNYSGVLTIFGEEGK